MANDLFCPRCYADRTLREMASKYPDEKEHVAIRAGWLQGALETIRDGGYGMGALCSEHALKREGGTS